MAKGGCIQGKGLLVLNPPADFQAGYEAGYKSRKNSALYKLSGLRGIVRRNAAGTCFVLEVGRGEEIAVGTAGELGFTTDQMNVMARDGRAWWCKDTNGGGCASIWVVASNAVAAVARQVAAQRAASEANRLAECAREAAFDAAKRELNRSPWVAGRQWNGYWDKWMSADAESNGIAGVSERAVAHAGALQNAAEEAEIMAGLEAEQAAAIAAAEQAAELAAVSAATGLSPEQWRGMSQKQQGQALHRARLAGRM